MQTESCHKHPAVFHTGFKQSGSTLLISLILLGVLSVLGLSSMRSALVEEKISTNIHDRHLASEAAESALRAGERTLITSSIYNSPGFYDTFTDSNIPDTLNWTSAAHYQVNSNIWDSSHPQPAPKFKIELFDAPDYSLNLGEGKSEEEALAGSSKFYRIIGYGEGRATTTAALEESTIIFK